MSLLNNNPATRTSNMCTSNMCKPDVCSDSSAHENRTRRGIFVGNQVLRRRGAVNHKRVYRLEGLAVRRREWPAPPGSTRVRMGCRFGCGLQSSGAAPGDAETGALLPPIPTA